MLLRLFCATALLVSTEALSEGVRDPVLAGSFVVPQLGDIVIPPQTILEVVCFGKGGAWAGTAFRVGKGLLLSVNHVTSNGSCFIAGKPLSVKYKSPTSDFSMVNGDDGPFLPIDCGGFVKGRKYVALGHARGLDLITQVELTATGETDGTNGQAVLSGVFSVVPGQSGGPVIDEETGKVVGTVNMENYEDGLSWSVPLSGTPVCQGKAA